MTHTADPTARFSDRAADYVKYRPTYPVEVVTTFEKLGLNPTKKIADLGSGTGISSELFLKYGYAVIGVEPNDEMRAAAEKALAKYPNFGSLNGTAESTRLPNASIDFVVAAQAFHWFDQPKVKVEMKRILKKDGWVVLMWNDRKTESSPFLEAYDAFLRAHTNDYEKVTHKVIGEEALKSFLGAQYGRITLPNFQKLDFDGLLGRLVSSSYAPSRTDPKFEPMCNALKALFEEHQKSGTVRIEYDTQLYHGKL